MVFLTAVLKNRAFFFVVALQIIPLLTCSGSIKVKKLSDSKANDLTKLMRNGQGDSAIAIFQKASEEDRTKYKPLMFSTYLYVQNTKAGKLYRDGNITAAFLELRKIFEFPGGNDMLDAVLNGPYNNTAISIYTTTLDLVAVLGNYLSASRYACYTHVWTSNDEFMIDWLRAIITKLDKGNSSLASWKLSEWNEEQVKNGQIRKLHSAITDRIDRGDLNYSTCDSLFGQSSTAFSVMSLPASYLITLRYAPGFLFLTDSIRTEICDRPYGKFSGNIFDLFYTIIGRALLAFDSKNVQDTWFDKMQEFSHNKIPVKQGNNSWRHFTPASIKWCYQNLIPAPEAEVGSYSLKKIYQDLFSHEIRLPVVCYLYLKQNNLFESESKNYKVASAKTEFNGPHYLKSRFSSIQLNGYGTQIEKERVAVYIGFWLRRSIDGSADELWWDVCDFLKRYDPDFYASTVQQWQPEKEPGGGLDIFKVFGK